MKRRMALLLALLLALSGVEAVLAEDVSADAIPVEAEVSEEPVGTEELAAEAAEVEAPEETAPEEAPEAELPPGDAGEAEGEDALAEANGITMIDENHWYDDSGLVYEKFKNWSKYYVRVTGYNGDATEVVIPDKSNGYSVWTIGDGAFENENITKVTLPEKLASVGEKAFKGTNLTSLALPDFTSYIYEEAFAECRQLKEIQFGSGNSELWSIAEGAFKRCTSLTSVALPNSAVSIYAHAFEDCSALEKLELGGADKIGESAFMHTSLRSVTLPDSVTEMGEYAFADCPWLEKVSFGSGLKVIPKGAFRDCYSLREAMLPEGIEEIGDGAFMLCNLERAALPASLKSIGKDAFAMQFVGTKGGEAAVFFISNPYTQFERNGAYAEAWYENWHATDANKADLSECYVYAPSQFYTGKAKKPDPVVAYGGKIYTPGNDFTVQYANNKKVGEAVMTLTGSGPLSGTTTGTFFIIPRNTKLKSVKSKKKGRLTVTWKKQATQTTGYEIFYIKVNDSGISKIESKIVKGAKKTSVTLKGLESGATYRVMIATYKTVKGEQLYGVTSDFELFNTMKTVKVK